MSSNTVKQALRLLAVGCAMTATSASGQECSNSDFKGRYGVQAQVSIVPAGVEGKHNWVAGTLVADGAGVITEWKETFTVVPPNSDERLVLERDAVAAAASRRESR